MNDIEHAARPALSAMIRGQAITLDRPMQDKVATWLGLKAIVNQYGQSPIRPVRSDWIDHLYEHRRPPNTWQIRLSRYVGDHPVRMASGEITSYFRHNLVPFTMQEPGLVFGAAIVYFFGQVYGVGRKTVVPAQRDLFGQIWPHPLLRLDNTQVPHNDLVAWPPKGWLNDADVERYSRNITGDPPPSSH